MEKRVERADWLTPQGIALIGGWRRSGDGADEIAAKIGVEAATLKRWADEHEEIDAALRIDREVADFMVEDVLFARSLEGDHKAYEFWLKHRMPEKWGKAATETDSVGRPVDYTSLAELINNPKEREGSFE